MDTLATLDDAIAWEFARAAQAVIAQVGTCRYLVASHGQTVYHRPAPTPPLARRVLIP